MATSTETRERLSTITMKPQAVSENSFTSPELTLRDRCDRCGAAAYVRTVKGDNELLFCGHHARKNIAALDAEGWKTDDQTNRAFAGNSASRTD